MCMKLIEDVTLEGLEFVYTALEKIEEGICPACNTDLPEPKPLFLTCSPECLTKWINAIITDVGAISPITDVASGITYKVPTRLILECGIRPNELNRYCLS